MTVNELYTSEFRFKAVAVFGAALTILFVRFYSGTLLSQIGHPDFSAIQQQVFYSWFQKSGVANQLFQHPVAVVMFDILLFLFPLLFVITKRKEFAIAFSLLASVYMLTYNLATVHYYHGFVGVLVISIPFWTNRLDRFNFLWEIARYYMLYIFSSAAIWKIARGSVFYTEQLSNILKSQQLDLLIQHPDSLQAQCIQYLIANPSVSHGVLISTVLIQLSFAIGFFTKKFDLFLFALTIIFCFANYFVMSIVSAELLILSLTLLPWNKIATLFQQKAIF